MFLKNLLKSNSLRWNFIGNLTGRIWLGGMNIVTVPVFVYLVGADAFGVVSLVGSIQSVLVLLDLGLAGTANREVATWRDSENRGHVADIVRTFEWIYWIVACLIGFVVAALSGFISHSWVNKQSLLSGDIQLAIILGGITLAARWPVALYTGILQGLEQQVLQNGLVIIAATTRVALTVLALVFISRTVYCFLITQAAANVMEAWLCGYVVHRLVDIESRGKFKLEVVRRVWRFALGFNLIGAFGSLVSGIDKLLISKLLPLVELTYYSVAGTATGALQVFNAATQASLFPRMSSCWKKKDLVQMRRLYLLGLRCAVYVCTGPAILLIFFPSEIVRLWTRSPELAQHVRPLLPILAIAVLANTAVAAPLNVILASGHTRFPLLVNGISLPIMICSGYLAIRSLGSLGAAWVWMAWNCACFAVYGQYCFRKVFGGEAQPRLWGMPLIVLATSAIIGFLSHGLMPKNFGSMPTVLWLMVTTIMIYGVSIITLECNERSVLLVPIKKFRDYLYKQVRNSRLVIAVIGY